MNPWTSMNQPCGYVWKWGLSPQNCNLIDLNILNGANYGSLGSPWNFGVFYLHTYPFGVTIDIILNSGRQTHSDWVLLCWTVVKSRCRVLFIGHEWRNLDYTHLRFMVWFCLFWGIYTILYFVGSLVFGGIHINKTLLLIVTVILG